MPCSPQVYVAIFLDPVIFHLPSAKSLQQIFWWKPMPLCSSATLKPSPPQPLVSAGQAAEMVEQCAGHACGARQAAEPLFRGSAACAVRAAFETSCTALTRGWPAEATQAVIPD